MGMENLRRGTADEAAVAAAAEYLSRRVPYQVGLGIVLGSGLGGVRKAFRAVRAFPYRDIPHFPVSTVEGHRGELVLGRRGKVDAWIMDGRVHLYEGHDILRVTFPARVLARLGAATMIITNAAGAVNPKLRPGDVMLIESHIDLMWKVVPEVTSGPLIRHRPYYSKRMLDLAESVAGRIGIRARKGVLLASTGPSYETGSEVEFARKIGADAATMSTIPEVTVCHQLGITVLGMSLLTNVAAQPKAGHEEVLVSARRGSKHLEKLILAVAGKIQGER
jgi:purine-nucleoside phosphorylase